MTKILNLDKLAETLDSIKKKGKKVVHCHGVFDLLHIGHIRYLEEAADMGDVLVVTVTPDRYVNKGPGRPAFTDRLRVEALAALGCVDYGAIYNWATAGETIRILKPTYYVKGPDYKKAADDLTGNILKEANAVRDAGGEIRFTKNITFSSSKLLVEHSGFYNKAQKSYIHQIREKYKMSDINSFFEVMKNKKVMLIGEIIIDEYVYCNALGKSGKEPVMVVKRLQAEQYYGGILAIANHLSAFCDQIKIHSYVGEDNRFHGDIIDNLPKNVSLDVIHKLNSPTILKRRYLDEYSKHRLLGVYEIDDTPIKGDQESLLLERLKNTIDDYDLVIVADYAHGLITPAVVKLLGDKARFLSVNTQVNAANLGFHTVSKYPKADFVCIHEGELRHDYRSRTRPEQELTKALYEKMKCQQIVITQGKRGSLGYTEKEGFTQCPAFATKIVDRVGAGDSVLGITSLCLASGLPMDLTLLIGNLTGAQSVAIMGNKRAIDKTLLLKSIKALM